MNEQRPLSDDFVFYAANIALSAAAIADTERASGEQQTPPEGIPTPGPDVLHIYIVDEPAPEPDASGPVVESTIAPSPGTERPPTTGDLETKADGRAACPVSTATRPSRRHLVWWLGVGMSATLVLLAALLVLSPLVFAPPVTVTIIPVASSLSTTMQVSVSTQGLCVLPKREG